MKMNKNIIIAALFSLTTFTACSQVNNNTKAQTENLEAKKDKFPITKTESEWRIGCIICFIRKWGKGFMGRGIVIEWLFN